MSMIRDIMLIRLGVVSALVVLPLVAPLVAQAPAAEQLKVGEFVTFILPEASNHPEPRDPDVKFGVGGSANEQATDVLVYGDGQDLGFFRTGEQPVALRRRNRSTGGAHRSRVQAAQTHDKGHYAAPEADDSAANPPRRDSGPVQVSR